MTTTPRGLYPKYRVERNDGKPVGWCFVLEDTDPHTPDALEAYAESLNVTEHELFHDLMDKVYYLRQMHAAFDGRDESKVQS